MAHVEDDPAHDETNVDRWRFSSISHGQMRFWNPLPADGLAAVLRALPIARGAQVLDYAGSSKESPRGSSPWGL